MKGKRSRQRLGGDDPCAPLNPDERLNPGDPRPSPGAFVFGLTQDACGRTSDDLTLGAADPATTKRTTRKLASLRG